MAFVFVGGGVVGGLFGSRLAKHLSDKKGALNSVFAALIFVVAICMLYRSVRSLGFI
ncbi:MAG: hypothetical protein PSV23_15455 [Brevundimonas sp.]|nr:hypothetical protein [Brevundimonas sp.]